MSNSTLSSDLVAGGADEDLIGTSGVPSSCSLSLCWFSSSSSSGGGVRPAGGSGASKIRSFKSSASAFG